MRTKKNKLKSRKHLHQLYRTGKICNDIESGPSEGNEGMNGNQMCVDACDIGVNTTAHEHISCHIINSCENKGKENSTENIYITYTH